MHDQQVPLMQAALELREPYERARRLVLTGALAGERAARGWFVSRASLDAYKAQRSAGPNAPHTA